MEYHPIIVTDTEEVYGFEALARGRRPGLRSPEVLLDIASEANLLWDLSRLFRKWAVEGIAGELERGFKFAVDDAGSGYAGLGSIANPDPDYIKLDISLISNIDTNFMKQNLVETLVRFAEDHGVKVVAEGVERREEFETVRDIGVHLTQGFLFHRPRFAGLES